VLMAIELLLFEFRARSIIPVALASAVATAVRMAFRGAAPVFPMPLVAEPTGGAIVIYIALGALVGFISVYVTRAVFFVEDSFEHLPVHWMWWPAIGAVAVGVIGYFEPRTMGVGYDNIDAILQGVFPWKVLLLLGVLKFVSWAIALGSGTSGGTLAPIFTIGGAVGGLCGYAVAALAPGTAVDPRLAALVGMAALFTGASHSMLAWVVFAFETTRQPVGLLPLLGGCAAAYMVSMLNMRYSIMTEKIARRGLPVARGYEVDYLRQQVVRDWATKPAVSLEGADTVASVVARLTSNPSDLTHQGFPVVEDGKLIGVVTRRDLLSGRDGPLVRDLISHPPAIAYAHWPLREAADEMVRRRVGRLPVVDSSDPSIIVGVISRSDLLRAYGTQLDEVTMLDEPVVGWRKRASAS
jgi:CIC family chloride channel protein